MPDPASRNWWSLSKSPDASSRTPKISFNSFASAIGLKSKKHRPSLAIQDPPPSLLASPTTPTYPTRSRVGSTGPLTPVDYECQSLLTLSDADPFAGRPLTIPPVPQIPSQKTSPPLDVHRISCSSSSSLSTNHTYDASGLTESRKLFNKRSINNLQFSRSSGSTDPLIRYPSLSSSFSPRRPGSSTVVAGDQTHTLARPKLRARGMTDGGSTQKAGFFSDERPALNKLSQKSSTSTFSPAISTTDHTLPRVMNRQASLSRLFAPPCAPPIHNLPEKPHSPTKASSPVRRPNRYTRTESMSSSRISLVSSSSNDMFPAPSYPPREKRSSERSIFSQDHDPDLSCSPAKRESKTAPSSPRTLKKTLSHQSLTNKSNISPPILLKLPPGKQRTFHHTCSPMPPIPDPGGQHNSADSTYPSLTDFSPKAATERRTSGNGALGRKRLNSHSNPSRPSISHCNNASITTEDDSQSLFSLRSDRSSHLVPFKPWASPQTTPQSLLRDDTGSPVAGSPARSSEYMPQPILSAAEVAKLEASIENSSDRLNRSKAPSILSTSTAAPDREDSDFTPVGLSPPPTSRPHSKQGGMTAKSFATKNPAFYSPVSSRARSPSLVPPPENNGNPEDDSRSTITYQPSSELSTNLTTSLPPPPRSRKWSQRVPHSKRSSTAPSISSFVAKPSRSQSITEKNMHRQSIMRKPSFLEIDDDTDQDIDLFSGEAMTESFLDLARESFEVNHKVMHDS